MEEPRGARHLKVDPVQRACRPREIVPNLFVLVETVYLFNCKSLENPPWPMGWFSNPWVRFGSGAMLALQMAFTYVPVFNHIFQTAPIGILEWSWIVAVAAACAATVEAAKWLQLSRASQT